MILTATKRPRNVDAPRAAAILYGDWGSSKIYIIGLAFAVAGYSSIWLILPMCSSYPVVVAKKLFFLLVLVMAAAR